MKRYQKITACVLAVALSATGTGLYAYSRAHDANAVVDTSVTETETPVIEDEAAVERAAADGSLYKDETVYVLCNDDASPREVIVSDWLKNPGALTSIPDSSDLRDIENVKGDEAFSQTDTELT